MSNQKVKNVNKKKRKEKIPTLYASHMQLSYFKIKIIPVQKEIPENCFLSRSIELVKVISLIHQFR